MDAIHTAVAHGGSASDSDDLEYAFLDDESDLDPHGMSRAVVVKPSRHAVVLKPPASKRV